MLSDELSEELLCSICLSIFTNPVTLTCGHNFCWGCIDHHLNTQARSPHYSCPKCGTELRLRPKLQRNINLHNVAECFRSTQEKMTRICCTYCVDPAVKSCLHCEAFLCNDHLKVHSKEEEHLVTDHSSSMENKKCSVHKKILEYYCTEDAACICASCLVEEHNGHEILSLKETSEKKKGKMRNVLKKLITKREKTEVRVKSLEKRKRIAQRKAAGRGERVTAQFIEIRRRLDDLEERVLNEISRQKEQLLLSHMIQKLEIKKGELSRKMKHIEELCNMTDPLTVLQEPDTGDLCDHEEEEEEEDEEDTGGHDKPHDVDGDVLTRILIAGFADMMKYLQTISPTNEEKRKRHCRDQSSHRYIQASLVSGTEYGGDSVIVRPGGAGEEVMDGIYGEGPVDLLLDVNTAANDILLSDDLKTATWTDINQNRPETAKRFQYPQVMSIRRFTSGRHYWDVEVSSSGVWRLGMCYPSIDRRGGQSLIGHNKKSWCLWGGEVYNECLVMHNGEEIPLPYQICSDGIRIYLDYEAGELSFYELRDTIIHIYTFKTTFIEPLHAVFYVVESSIKKHGSSICEEPSS